MEISCFKRRVGPIAQTTAKILKTGSVKDIVVLLLYCKCSRRPECTYFSTFSRAYFALRLTPTSSLTHTTTEFN